MPGAVAAVVSAAVEDFTAVASTVAVCVPVASAAVVCVTRGVALDIEAAAYAMPVVAMGIVAPAITVAAIIDQGPA
jgi:hypothetical protein